MQKLVLLLISSLGILPSCSQPEPTGKRMFLAKSNISFVLPDSSLAYSKPILWPADYSMGSYGEAGGFYHNQDSSIIISIYVQVYPNPEQRTLQWRILANEKRHREDLAAKSRGLTIIEHFAADSNKRTVTIDYHMPQRPEKGWRGQASCEREFTFYGPQRTIKFWFFAPNNALNRQAIAAACASVCVDSTYLHAGAKPYPAREYRD